MVIVATPNLCLRIWIVAAAEAYSQVITIKSSVVSQ